MTKLEALVIFIQKVHRLFLILYNQVESPRFALRYISLSLFKLWIFA